MVFEHTGQTAPTGKSGTGGRFSLPISSIVFIKEFSPTHSVITANGWPILILKRKKKIGKVKETRRMIRSPMINPLAPGSIFYGWKMKHPYPFLLLPCMPWTVLPGTWFMGWQTAAEPPMGCIWWTWKMILKCHPGFSGTVMPGPDISDGITAVVNLHF